MDVKNNKISLKGVTGIFLMGFLVLSICCVMSYINEKTAQYDCYVWGFKHGECRYGQAIENPDASGFCREHLKPVQRCEGLAETGRGIANALRFLGGEQVEYPPDRDYRTFDVHPWSRPN